MLYGTLVRSRPLFVTELFIVEVDKCWRSNFPTVFLISYDDGYDDNNVSANEITISSASAMIILKNNIETSFLRI